VTEYYAGQDLAKRRDYSALAVLERTNDDKLKLVYLKEWPHVDYKVVIADTKRIYKRFQWYKLGVDRSGIGDSIIEEYYNEYAEGIVFNAKTKEEMIEYIILLRQQGRLILPKHGAEELIHQLGEQERILSDAGTVKFRHPSGRHDDLLWALALACYVAKEEMEKPAPFIMTFSADELDPPDPRNQMIDRVLGRFRESGITVTDVKITYPGEQ
jgi:phage FluMu gp28-like protein